MRCLRANTGRKFGALIERGSVKTQQVLLNRVLTVFLRGCIALAGAWRIPSDIRLSSVPTATIQASQ